MDFDINRDQIVIIAGIAVVIVLLVASMLITPDWGPKEEADDEKGRDG